MCIETCACGSPFLARERVTEAAGGRLAARSLVGEPVAELSSSKQALTTPRRPACICNVFTSKCTINPRGQHTDIGREATMDIRIIQLPEIHSEAASGSGSGSGARADAALGTRSGSRHVGASLHPSLGPSLSPLSDPFARRIMIRRIDVFSELYREDPGTSSISASRGCVLAPLPPPAP